MMVDVPVRTFFMMNGGGSYPYKDLPNLNDIATETYGMKYVGQQTDGCLSRGNYIFNFSAPGNVEDWCTDFDQYFSGWKKAYNIGADYDFEIYRKAPGIGEVLADLIRRGVLPMGVYLIAIDW